MTETITAEEFQRRVRQKAGFIDRPSKYGAVKVKDPETGKMVDSKGESRVLAALRLECRQNGWILCQQAEIPIEGGVHRVDFLILKDFDNFCGPRSREEGRPIYEGEFFMVESKGVDHPDGKRRRKQVLERHGLEIQVIHTGRKARKGRP